MKHENDGDLNPRDRLARRDWLKQVTAASFATAWGAHRAQAAALAPPTASTQRSEAIRTENEKAGTTDWQLTYTRIEPGTRWRSKLIEGYASRSSVRAGETIQFMVSTDPPSPFTIDIYRMGYYAGSGGRHMLQLGPVPGTVQADPPVGQHRLRECTWEPAIELTIPADWPSGVYLGKLSATKHRYQSYLIFIVRDERQADLVFQCSDNTWQAYNRWPDHFSLYDDGQREWALVPDVYVSYDRPYGKYCQILDHPLTQGSGEFLLWEFPLAFWLEKHGYDVTYVSNTDVHSDAANVLRGQGFLSVGHDEYWSREMFRHVQAAVKTGVNVAFLSGNTCCFVAPLFPSSQGVAQRIFTRAGRYGGLSDAEKAYMGPFPEEGPNEANLIGARTISPFNGSADWIATHARHWIFEGTGMKNGDRIPGLVGWEFHGDPAEIPGLEVVARGQTTNGGDQSATYTATIYPGPRGNWVFNASTIYWAQGLSSPPGHVLPYSHDGRPHGPDRRVQHITQNLLKQFLA